jgi:hypothetical protein
MTETLDATPDFLNEPTFLPRVTQHDGRAIEEALAATLFDKGVRLRGAVVEASYAATDPPLLKRLREDCILRLVEPQSQRFTTRRFLETEQLKGLAYAPSEPITPTYPQALRRSAYVLQRDGESRARPSEQEPQVDLPHWTPWP